MSKQRLLQTIGIITALPEEYAACKKLIPGRPDVIPGEGAGRRYWVGTLESQGRNQHHLVLGLTAGPGNNMASTRATLMLEHYPNLRAVIMVGIAGGVPKPDTATEHVRLGDIVVSNDKGVIQYDFVKNEYRDSAGKDGVFHELRSSPRPPVASLLEAVRLLQSAEILGNRTWESHISNGLKTLRWNRPPLRNDVLLGPPPLNQMIPHPPDPLRRRRLPRVFHGPIAAANTLLKNPIMRDLLRDTFAIKAVEMEASGIADATWHHEVGYLVVRGICDYCDKAKGDEWHNYAALVAAAYARALIESMPPYSIAHAYPTSSAQNRTWAVKQSISIERMPHTGPHLFGRSRVTSRLNSLRDDRRVNIISVIGFGGVGKSGLVNHWLAQMARNRFRDLDRVYAWSFYTQGTSERVVSADQFFQATLKWFGDVDPSVGSPWEKGQRLGSLINRYRSLIVLDGMEPLQYPPGLQEGRLKDQGLKALVLTLAALNRGVCVITSRLPLSDVDSFSDRSVRQIDLSILSPTAGAEILKSLGVLGSRSELQSASVEFGGHALALTLLGGYLTDVFAGDVRRRAEIGPLESDVRSGGHARRVMASYEKWFALGPELSVLRVLGLFDRPAEDHALSALRTKPDIANLTSRLIKLSEVDWRQCLAKLERARLLTRYNGGIDAHPLVREHFREQLKNHYRAAWKRGNLRLFQHFRDIAQRLPNSVEEMEPLFQAVACACNAGLHQEALNEIYISRIMRGHEFFASNKLGALGALLATLSHFFEGDWHKPITSLGITDQLFVAIEAGRYLTEARGYAAKEVGICYRRARELCEITGNKSQLFEIMLGLCRYYRVSGNLHESLTVANEMNDLRESIPPSLFVPTVQRALSSNHFYLGHFQLSIDHAKRGMTTAWERAQATENARIDVNEPTISCLGYSALAHWFMGYPDQSRQFSQDAGARAKDLAHPHTIAITLLIHGMVAQFRRDYEEALSISKELTRWCSDYGFSLWRISGDILSAWALAKNSPASRRQAITAMKRAIEEWTFAGAKLFMPYWKGLLADILIDASKYRDASEHIAKALALAGKTGEAWWTAELIRLKAIATFRSDSSFSEAESCLSEALDLARCQRARMLQLRIACSLAELHPSRQSSDSVRSLIETIAESITEGHDTNDHKDSMRILSP